MKRIQSGADGAEDVEGGEDDEEEEEGVVVEDGEGGRLVVSNLVLLPQNPEDAEDGVNRGRGE